MNGELRPDKPTAFGPGPGPPVSTPNNAGAALAAIHGLNRKVEEQRTELKTRETEIRELKSRNGSLETRLEKLEKLLGTLVQRGETK